MQLSNRRALPNLSPLQMGSSLASASEAENETDALAERRSSTKGAEAESLVELVVDGVGETTLIGRARGAEILSAALGNGINKVAMETARLSRASARELCSRWHIIFLFSGSFLVERLVEVRRCEKEATWITATMAW